MKNDGGAAFPRFEEKEGWTSIQPTGGMSLRDYMAGQALVGILSNPNAAISSALREADSMTEAAYMFADAMLKAREAE